MADIIFYEKPGCINGGKQKKILEAAGHRLICKDILTTPWSEERLTPFLMSRNPEEIMNHTAPDIKNGTITPANLSFKEALALMISSPILIKRPLIHVEGTALQGFTNEKLKPYLGNWDESDDVVTCPNLRTISCDEKR
ncbi:MAG: hypothetical protein D6B25_20695 [Desulfobulbaceae bacterium]|nr:MAG: hypothetical protein D6B25_20695 [Desulfobulbaceae bacterium]